MKRAERLMKRFLQSIQKKPGQKFRLETYSSSDYRKELEAAFAEGSEPDVYTGSLADMTKDFNDGQLHNFLYLYDEEMCISGRELE